MASIHKSKITLPACSSSSVPASQSKDRVPPAETQRLAAALFITSDPRPVSGHVKDTRTHTHIHTHPRPFSGCIKKHAVRPVQENKSLLNRQLEFLLVYIYACLPSFSPYSHSGPPLHPLNFTSRPVYGYCQLYGTRAKKHRRVITAKKFTQGSEENVTDSDAEVP